MNNSDNNLEIKGNETTIVEKKAYHSPKLTSYGNLSELVKFNPQRGADGGVADCTLS